ncbi:MFS general substrate transporter [Trametes versicolor FP-101664 SS1]|uniref:MFS general substrate transporter n=1 Tax=Trametes versicolor (strain FP-101664) TaxID=717944 RepID=UPI0004621F96|nr:MFS general substrate transporter [Trametes versicolor FP-101664 SS1]EIW53158.1 MFS general substrate transporter [Trametes versicolor FP-101664 SS1]
MSSDDVTPPSPVEKKVPDDAEAMVSEARPLTYGEDGLPPPPAYTAEEERRLWRKIDMRIIPIATLMYLVSYLDRGNIGNAKLQGLLTQLDLSGQRYNIALVSYSVRMCMWCLMLIISGRQCTICLVLKKFRPSRWLPGIALAWGIVSTLQGLVKTYPQLVGVRVCLGISESGLAPGIYYLLSLWYPRHMLQWRFGLFWGGATFSGAFSGLLAYGISFMSGAGGLLGWSWIFIIEGLFTIVASLIAFAVFVDLPATATFLTQEERSFVINRLKEDNGSVGEEEEFQLRHITDALCDWKIILWCISNMAITTPMYGASLFLPTIINGFVLGFNPAISQLLTVPAYAIATVTVVICSALSDHTKLRSPFIVGGLMLAFTGYAIQASDASIGVKYFGTYLIVIGAYEAGPFMISWLGNNTVGHYKRGVGIGMQITFGTMGGIIASNAFQVQDAPRYLSGHATVLGFIGMGLILVPLTVLAFWRGNRRRDAAQRQEEETGTKVEYTAEELKRMGERAPTFRYTL